MHTAVCAFHVRDRAENAIRRKLIQNPIRDRIPAIGANGAPEAVRFSEIRVEFIAFILTHLKIRPSIVHVSRTSYASRAYSTKTRDLHISFETFLKEFRMKFFFRKSLDFLEI